MYNIQYSKKKTTNISNNIPSKQKIPKLHYETTKTI